MEGHNPQESSGFTESTKLGDSKLPDRSPLLRLPDRLLWRIRAHLPAESRVALALVNHHLKDTLRGAAFDPTDVRVDFQATWVRFLRLLDRDLQFLVFCEICNKIHCPTVAGISARFHSRPCVYHQHGRSPLGADLVFTRVYFIMRAFRAGQGYLELLHSLSFIVPARDRHPRLNGSHCRTARINTRQGNLIVKHESYLLSEITEELSTRTIEELGTCQWWPRPICPHWKWGEAFEFLLNGLARTDRSPSPEEIAPRSTSMEAESCSDDTPLEATAIDRNLICALRHPSPCLCGSKIGIVQSCQFCYTDFCLSWVRTMPDRRRLLVTTSWVNLGAGETVDDPIWQSHQYRPHGFIRPPGPSGEQYRAYEGVTSAAKYEYSPSKIHRECLELDQQRTLAA